LETYFDRSEEHAKIFYSLARRFGLSLDLVPHRIIEIKEKREDARAGYEKHVLRMKQFAENLMGPEEKRSDYESQTSVRSPDNSCDEAYNAT